MSKARFIMKTRNYIILLFFSFLLQFPANSSAQQEPQQNIELELSKELSVPMRVLVVQDYSNTYWSFPVSFVKQFDGNQLTLNEECYIHKGTGTGNPSEIAQRMLDLPSGRGQTSYARNYNIRAIKSGDSPIKVSKIVLRNRIATIRAVGGKEYKFQKLTAENDLWINPGGYNINLDRNFHRLVSIKRTGNSSTIKYVDLDGTLQTVQGSFTIKPEYKHELNAKKPGFTGATSFGNITILPEQVLNLSFDNPPPDIKEEQDVGDYSVKVKLVNGKELTLSKITRVYPYFNKNYSPPKPSGWSNGYGAGIIVNDGTVKYTLGFPSKIKSIDFTGNKVTITAPNGEILNGMLENILYFRGLYPCDGWVFIKPDNIKSITLL